MSLGSGKSKPNISGVFDVNLSDSLSIFLISLNFLVVILSSFHIPSHSFASPFPMVGVLALAGCGIEAKHYKILYIALLLIFHDLIEIIASHTSHQAVSSFLLVS